MLTLAVLLALPLDNAQEFGMRRQQQGPIIVRATLHRLAIMVQGAQHHRDRDPFQRFLQGLGDLLAVRQQHGHTPG